MSTLDQEMNMYENKPLLKPALIYGAIIAGVIIVVNLVFFFAGNVGSGSETLLDYAIWLGGAFFAIYSYKTKFNDGNLTFGRGLGMGVLTFAIASIFNIIYTQIYAAFINKSFFEDIKEMAYNALIDQGNSHGQAMDAMEFMGFMYNPVGISVLMVLSYLFLGTIFSLIASAVLKNQ